MSDQNITATPYPFYATGGDDDSVQHAVLTSHAGASIERNQDSQFAALSRQNLQGRVSDGRRESVETKFEVVVAQKDAEIRAAERFAELKAELAAMRAEGLQRDVASLRAEMVESKAAARAAAADAVLAAIAKKIGL